ncbi:MAG: molybdopterin-dependent oxidoreductase [Vicinamibacterales bacterium]
MSSHSTSRRDLLKQLSMAGVGLSLVNVPGWSLPVLAQGDAIVPFTDIPSTFNPVPNAISRTFDIRKLSEFTPADQFFTTQHYGHPGIDLSTFRLKITGLINKQVSFSLDELKKMKSVELIAGFECSGNSPRSIEGLASNGKWTGVPLKALLDQAGVKPEAREFVFFGVDKGSEEIEWRTQKFTVDQQFGRALNREQAFSPDIIVAWALNGQPLTKHQGAPLRLIVPGWYGVANVKWLTHVHVQDDAYLGRFQARWYRTLRGEMIDGQMTWKESAVTRMRLKSVIARVTASGGAHTVQGFVLSNGLSPIKAVEVKVDEGPWQAATLDKTTLASKYSWKLFSYAWKGAAPGAHTLVSRAIDASGQIQPTPQELENKKSFLEDNSQFTRKLTI